MLASLLGDWSLIRSSTSRGNIASDKASHRTYDSHENDRNYHEDRFTAEADYSLGRNEEGCERRCRTNQARNQSISGISQKIPYDETGSNRCEDEEDDKQPQVQQETCKGNGNESVRVWGCCFLQGYTSLWCPLTRVITMALCACKDEQLTDRLKCLDAQVTQATSGEKEWLRGIEIER